MIRIFILLLLAAVIAPNLDGQFCSDLQKMNVGHLVKVPKATKANPSKVVSIYLETDLSTRNQLGSDAATEQWLQDLYMEMAMLYANDGVSTALTGTFWPANAGQDWSNGMVGGNIFTLLNAFGELRKNDPPGRLKHFVSLQGPLQGIAWVDVLQSDHNTFTDNNNVVNHFGPYGINLGLDVTQTIWNKIVLTHEAGHNFGSPHTHACVWGNGSQVIDVCQLPIECLNPVPFLSPNAEVNTIMSYCDDAQSLINGFGIEPGNLVRAKVANASRDLTDGHCAKIMYLADNVAGNYYATQDVIFHPGLDTDNMCVFIGCP